MGNSEANRSEVNDCCRGERRCKPPRLIRLINQRAHDWSFHQSDTRERRNLKMERRCSVGVRSVWRNPRVCTATERRRYNKLSTLPNSNAAARVDEELFVRLHLKCVVPRIDVADNAVNAVLPR